MMHDLKTGFIDIHSHLLPLQDGPRDMAQALRAIRIAEENNVTGMIFTPHYYSSDTAYDQNHVLETFQSIRDEIKRNKLRINVYLGNECVIDERIVEELKSGRAFTLNHTNYVLCEYPFYQVPCNYNIILYQMLEKGYIPIIAHPERNVFMKENYKNILELKENGCMIQINAGSLMGKYGRHCKKYSKKMLKDHVVDFIASDTHSVINRSPIVLKKSYKRIKKWIENKYLLDIFSINPGNMLNC